MKKIIIAAITLLLFRQTPFLQAQQEKNELTDWDIDAWLSNYSSVPLYEINRMPINICFIKSDQRYTGFVIAGHASKDVCGVASLRIKNLLDSLGYAANTIFSYGVGFDLRTSNWTQDYSNRLAQLEKTFLELRKQDPGQVRINYANHSVFVSTMRKIEDNTLWAQSMLSKKDSVNRIIFRYDDIDFPLPVPFYTHDGIIRFDIPKSDIGPIPGASIFGLDVVNRALKEVEQAIAINDKAAIQLSIYSPTTFLPTFKEHPYPIVMSTLKGIVTDTLFQIDPNKTVMIKDLNTQMVVRYYSMSELKAMCDQGMVNLPDKTTSGRKINPCTAYRNEQYFISTMNEKKERIQNTLQRLNKFYESQWWELSQLKTEFRALKKDNNPIAIDAFLRGWPFKTDKKTLDVQLDTWYNKRKAVWANVLKKNPAYKARYKTKTTLLQPWMTLQAFFNATMFSSRSKMRDNITRSPLIKC